MTRLDSLMPYDYAENAGNAANEYGLLLSELKRAFLDQLYEAREGDIHREDLNRFAKFCESNRCNCITFNYDDFLDEALEWTDRWNPYWGIRVLLPVVTGHHRQGRGVDNGLGVPAAETPRLDQLAAEAGLASPVAIDSITHHHEWSGVGWLDPQVGGHLEPEPVMVPPVLSKSGLVKQPVLRLVWSHAFARLETAHEVTFIGYSFPTTDMGCADVVLRSAEGPSARGHQCREPEPR